MRIGQGVSLCNLKLFLLLYADDAVIFSETRVGLQVALDTMLAYCQRWKIELNTSKIMIFPKGARLSQDLSFTYDNHPLKIVSNFIYLFIYLLYGSELWGFNHGRCVELVHIGHCKSILGVKRSTPNDMVRSNLGHTDLRCRRLYNIFLNSGLNLYTPPLIGKYMLHIAKTVKVVP